MDIHLQNTLTGKKEIFEPVTPGRVFMYNCGPTVYHYAHIGNLRSYVFADTLRRMFEWNGFEVTQVINITDVGHLVSDSDEGEDKMEKGARREGKTAWDVAKFYTEAFFEDLETLNIARENIIFPRATEYIDEQVAMVETLEKKGFTYRTSDGIYFDTSKFSDYGKLGNINLKGLEEGARVGINTEKKNPTDFALWKFSPQGTTRDMEWSSPWGVGFPGWHIECSAMSKALLGVTFDIHTGGIDHIPVHHNNEIAQSVCANDAPFVRYWMHNGFLELTGEKMAKSGENFLRLETFVEKGIDPLAYRYLLLTARYSSPLQFSWESLEASQNALNRLRDFVAGVAEETDKTDLAEIEPMKSLREQFTAYINDDLDTPKALALAWNTVNDSRLSQTVKKKLLLDFDKVLGLKLDKKVDFEIPEHVQELVNLRDKARAEKDFSKSDELRAVIEKEGFLVKDTSEGTQIIRK